MLRPAQVEALRELYEMRWLFAPIQPGGGKTLVTLLSATLLKSERPVLALPATLREKTQRDFARLRLDWRVRLPRLVSYEEMGRKDRHTLLSGAPDSLRPDLLLLDEADNIFRDSSRTRKVLRCIAECRPVTAPLSGSLLTANLMDYHHLLVGAGGDAAPCPTRAADAERWAAALDRDLGALHRIDAGALASIPGGYHEWLRGSRGVVPTAGATCNASVRVATWAPEMPPALQKVIDEVTASRLRPDDELLDEWELPDCLSMLALGFWQRWDPAPPKSWLNPRRDWWQYTRDVLDARLDAFDSASQIVAALDSGDPGELPDPDLGRAYLTAWRNVRDTFVPNPVPVWLSPLVLQQAKEKTAKEPHLIWTRWRAAGHLLQDCLGVPYYGGGNNPEGADPRKSIVVSTNAHFSGKNLQAFSRNLLLTIPAKAERLEQLMCRTWRSTQRSTTVHFDFISSIDYHRSTMARLVRDSRALSIAAGYEHPLNVADFV